MATTLKRLTYLDLDVIPEEQEGDRHELIDGELVVTPVPVMKHQRVSRNLVYALDDHVRHQGLGEVHSAPTGVRLADDNLLIPDACFVSHARLGIIGDKTIDGPPDLVVEILSPGTRRRDLGLKRNIYARFSVPEYWIVDPDAQTVTVLTLVNDQYEEISPNADGTVRSLVLPDLNLTFEAVFKGV
jgi:Uma2 family endonuclease